MQWYKTLSRKNDSQSNKIYESIENGILTFFPFNSGVLALKTTKNENLSCATYFINTKPNSFICLFYFLIYFEW